MTEYRAPEIGARTEMIQRGAPDEEFARCGYAAPTAAERGSVLSDE